MAVEQMTKTERVMAAVQGEDIDRVPLCFWHHFRPFGSGRRLAEATYAFFVETFDPDIVKLMPDIPYPFPRRSVHSLTDWTLVEPINRERSRYATQNRLAIEALRGALGDDVPIVVTVFSPLAEAMHMAESRDLFLSHAQEEPTVVHDALAALARHHPVANPVAIAGLLGVPTIEFDRAVRLSVGRGTTRDEVEHAAEALAWAWQQLHAR